jgi:regulatory protein
MNDNSSFLNYQLALERYCDYQERCESEVLDKMEKLQVPMQFREMILQNLGESKYYDDLRFAKIYAKGKMEYKLWGRRKIYMALKQKHIKSEFIKMAFELMDEEQYFDQLKKTIQKKMSEIGIINSDSKKKKVINYALQKGYESELVWKAFKEIIKHEN